MTADEWDRRYGVAAQAGERVWSRGPNATVAALLADVAPGTAVDLGAGEGRNALWLAERGWAVTAVDFSVTGLEAGRRAAAARGVSVVWELADVTSWRPAHPVDLVLVAYLHLPAALLGPVLRSAATWVAPGGRLLVIGHDRENLERGVGGPRDPDVLYTPALLAGAADGLGVERCEQVLRTVAAGSGHGGDEGDQAVDTLLLARVPPAR